MLHKILLYCNPLQFNSLAAGRFQFNFRYVIFKLTLVNGGWGTSYEIALRWMPKDLTDDKSTLVQVMAWCRQATSHYLSQCWPRSMLPNGVTKPQWVKMFPWVFRKYPMFVIEWGFPNPDCMIKLVSLPTGYCIFIRNTLRPDQDGLHFADNIFKAFSWLKLLYFDWNFIMADS